MALGTGGRQAAVISRWSERAPVWGTTMRSGQKHPTTGACRRPSALWRAGWFYGAMRVGPALECV